ncbi:MAG: hypothetical protein LV481_08195 [Methylacidiphilales bacterium]|nr:hypothetical protein [Candidatus Methylacidiphilales bacterium]
MSAFRDINYARWLLVSAIIAIADVAFVFYGVDDPESIKTTMEFVCASAFLLLFPIIIPKMYLLGLVQLCLQTQLIGCDSSYSEHTQALFYGLGDLPIFLFYVIVFKLIQCRWQWVKKNRIW